MDEKSEGKKGAITIFDELREILTILHRIFVRNFLQLLWRKLLPYLENTETPSIIKTGGI